MQYAKTVLNDAVDIKKTVSIPKGTHGIADGMRHKHGKIINNIFKIIMKFFQIINIIEVEKVESNLINETCIDKFSNLGGCHLVCS